MVLIILLILLFLIKSSQIYFGYRSINNKILTCWASMLSLKLEISVLSKYFSHQKKKNPTWAGIWVRMGLLAVIQSKEYFTLTSSKTDFFPPKKLWLSVTFHLFQSHASIFNTEKFYVNFVKWWPIVQAYQHLGCKSRRNSTGDLRLPQEPFQCSWLTCPSFVAHQHAKAGSFPRHQSHSRYLSQHALPTKLSWKPW